MSTSSLSRMVTLLHFLQTIPLAPTPQGQENEPNSMTTAPGMYRSPSWGWRLSFDPARWRADEMASIAATDTLTLASRDAYTASTRMSFHTSPRGSDTLRARLEKAADRLADEHPGATIELALDADGGAIFKRLAESHWIGSYIISALPAGDLIVELDAMAIPGVDAVIIVRATSLPAEYERAFEPVDLLRAGMVYHGQAIATLGSKESGSRPRVQY